jgi:sulfur carrier protein ThiS
LLAQDLNHPINDSKIPISEQMSIADLIEKENYRIKKIGASKFLETKNIISEDKNTQSGVKI